MHFIIIAIACWQVNLVHLALSKLTKWYIIHFDQQYSPIMLALCLMLLVTYHALNFAGIIGLGLKVDKSTYCMAEIFGINSMKFCSTEISYF